MKIGPLSTQWRVVWVTVLAIGCAVFPGALFAQSGGLSGEVEVGANLAFGNAEQAVLLASVGVERGDSVFELSLRSLFAYGEASNAEGESFVNKRSWELSASGDYLPEARISPFAIGRLLSSFEKKIDRRWEAGAGAKYTFVDDDITRIDVSGALLAERTTPRDLEAAPVGVDDVLARWSWRIRASKNLSEGRLTLKTTNFFRPEFGEWGSYTVSSTTSVAFRLNERVSLKLSFLDEYDTEAVLRGARKNNDGQLVFSVLSTF